MNFALARSAYKGQLNYAAYLGMLGDIATVTGIYLFFKYRKQRKLAQMPEKLKAAREENLNMFPKKTEEMDYNMLSPYTPIPYAANKITKYQHAHIDLLGYINEKQLNVEDSYHSNFLDSYDNTQKQFNDWHDPYGLKKHEHGEGHH
eukprot:CAMPEP_0170519076 /NCGR_PEP_ID=MMETSP0209-20121228/4616_1 /TAXON_ID=665100 ORGANISM="Litonotus pictus, Strain P1" /NCGR_SAMPLE_ID=MMETSP0209 /ASSEMBLY_ACC=CAM_ASM_000301 /LENGTH=146 /DNA_ID=CAMNT_0010804869 /DNA_START=40 /DNA_END=480 /DNA_ORIENTATION=-